MSILRISGAVMIAATIGMSAMPATTEARPLGTVQGLPFWAQPYPYGYVYRRPPEHCIQVQQYEQFFAPPLTEVTFVCGDPPVSARY
jgi:hypothetical protein